MQLDFSASRYASRVIHGLPQNRTEDLLQDALKGYGVEVQYGCELTEISTGDDTAQVQLANGASQDFDWVVAADGTQSMIRQGLGIDYPGFDLDDEWSVADVDVDGHHQGFSAWIQKPPGEFVFVIPIEKNRVRVASSTSDALNTVELPFRVLNVRRTGCFRIAVRQAASYQKGRVLSGRGRGSLSFAGGWAGYEFRYGRCCSCRGCHRKRHDPRLFARSASPGASGYAGVGAGSSPGLRQWCRE